MNPKLFLMLLLIIASASAQISMPPGVTQFQVMTVCKQTGGVWNTTTDTPECDCPEYFKFDLELGCHNVLAESSCKKTQGVWVVNNLKSPPVGSCDCGFARKWSDSNGCSGGIIEAIIDFIRSLLPGYLTG